MTSSDARKYETAFGQALAEQLEQQCSTQADLASATGTSRSYVNQTMSGKKPVSPRWADLVADVLNLPEHERAKLHRAAATDAGFKLDLTKSGK